MRASDARLTRAGAHRSRRTSERKRWTSAPARGALLGALAALAALALASCGGESASDEAQTSPGVPAEKEAGDAQFPEIVAVEPTRGAEGSFDFAVTMSSLYDSAERYADGWRVLTVEGEVLAEMTLLHDHASEQPFTRSQSAVAVPDGAESVVIEGRDLENGYGGDTFTVELP